MVDCIFCKIIKGEIESQRIYEDDKVVAFKDIDPQAPTHLLIIPKVHYSNLLDIPEDELNILVHIHSVAIKLAKDLGLADKGFRIVNNCGKEGGQSVDHIHYHLLGGRQLTWPPG